MPAGDKRDFLVPGGGLGSRLLSRAVGEIESTEPDARARSSDEMSLVGARIGPYHILSLLGSGGMGSVYLADHSDASISRRVALKVVRDTAYGRSARERFARERRLLASLAHPHIAALYDSGETAAGGLYYTMEYVAGERITAYCRESVPTVAGRIAILRDVAGALACAHRSLIIHRDIKPSNVLVSSDGHVKLLDFGIAKSLVESTDPGLTQNSTGPMTPQYAAPEQFHGSALTVATDVYQFGVLMFHVLTGRLPLLADPRDPVAWAHAVAEEEPLSLTRALHLSTTEESADGERRAWASGTRLAGIRHALGGDLEAIVAKALAKDPAQRYISMEALSADLAAYLEGRPVQARRAGVFYRVRRFVTRNRAASIVAAIAFVMIATGSWLAIDRLRVERDRATAASATSRATTDFLVGLFTVTDPGENRGERLTANQILERGAQQLQSHPSEDPSVDAAVAIEIGRVYTSLGEGKRANAVLTAAIDRLDQIPRTSGLPARLFAFRGWVNYLAADYAAAAKDYARGRELAALIADPAERNLQEGGLAQRGSSLARRTGDLDKASTLIHQAIDTLTKVRGPDNPAMGPAWNELGILEWDLGNHQASIDAYEHALTLYRKAYGENDTRTLGTESNLAEVLVMNDRDDEAEPLLVDCIEKARKLQDGPNRLLANALDMLSEVRIDTKRFAEAAVLAAEADAMFAKLLGARHNYRAFALVHLGKARLGLKDGSGALAAFTESLDLRREAFGNEHKDTANSLWNLGNAEVELGDPASGEKHLRESLAIRTRVLPAGHVAIPRTRTDLIKALIALRNYEEAGAEATKAQAEFLAAHDTTPTDRQTLGDLSATLASRSQEPGAIEVRQPRP
ncbi:MAG TPA: serine/threonine-protein kinase [Rhodanobacteraceae bacterium]|nr:serine/threonine-protein kinase [Rhodanobacteraceae bacterium]